MRCGAQVEQSTRSTNRSFKKMVSQGIDPAEIYKAICSQRVELVFTAHPTQARQLLSNQAHGSHHLIFLLIKNGGDITRRLSSQGCFKAKHVQHSCNI